MIWIRNQPRLLFRRHPIVISLLCTEALYLGLTPEQFVALFAVYLAVPLLWCGMNIIAADYRGSHLADERDVVVINRWIRHHSHAMHALNTTRAGLLPHLVLYLYWPWWVPLWFEKAARRIDRETRRSK